MDKYCCWESSLSEEQFVHQVSSRSHCIEQYQMVMGPQGAKSATALESTCPWLSLQCWQNMGLIPHNTTFPVGLHPNLLLRGKNKVLCKPRTATTRTNPPDGMGCPQPHRAGPTEAIPDCKSKVSPHGSSSAALSAQAHSGTCCCPAELNANSDLGLQSHQDVGICPVAPSPHTPGSAPAGSTQHGHAGVLPGVPRAWPRSWRPKDTWGGRDTGWEREGGQDGAAPAPRHPPAPPPPLLPPGGRGRACPHCPRGRTARPSKAQEKPGFIKTQFIPNVKRFFSFLP